jgi:hypothetical protein
VESISAEWLPARGAVSPSMIAAAVTSAGTGTGSPTDTGTTTAIFIRTTSSLTAITTTTDPKALRARLVGNECWRAVPICGAAFSPQFNEGDDEQPGQRGRRFRSLLLFPRGREVRSAEDNMTDPVTWPLLPLQAQLAPWVTLFIALAIVVAFVIVVVDTVERQRD